MAMMQVKEKLARYVAFAVQLGIAAIFFS